MHGPGVGCGGRGRTKYLEFGVGKTMETVLGCGGWGSGGGMGPVGFPFVQMCP